MAKEIYEKTICLDPFKPFRTCSGRSCGAALSHGLRFSIPQKSHSRKPP